MPAGSLSIDVHLTAEDLRSALVADVRNGLGAEKKWLSPVWFYDDRGSGLFDAITRLPEYYLTRAERRLLEANAYDIAVRAGADTLVELGAGTCDKSRVLLGAMREVGTLQRYVPLDVSETTLWEAASELATEYPGLSVNAVVGDFLKHVDQVPSTGDRMVAFLGSTIGNLAPEARSKFLVDLRSVLGPGDTLLLGTDLVKEPARLLAAYDDTAGLTAAFNRNVLLVLNSELGADFDPSRFDHVAIWDSEANWIEMRLRAVGQQVVEIEDLAMTVGFADGEDLRTEISAKFTLEGVQRELHDAGFSVESTWQDPEGFLLTLASPTV
ncbi:MAG TPA: L-histidine N(alpha)-methyltransferase [Acidimicrobiales bacterium]|nr:L-histidine N(alpha)-methyltransferase [Acidimicrobiales bacterium]